MDTVTQTVRSLLEGPTNWLDPVVDSRFPTGTALRKGVTSLAPDDRSMLKVPLNKKADNVGQRPARMMAAQLLYTVQDLTSARVEQVELQRSDSSPLCVLGADRRRSSLRTVRRAGPTASTSSTPRGTSSACPGSTRGSGDPEPVTGPFGDGRCG